MNISSLVFVASLKPTPLIIIHERLIQITITPLTTQRLPKLAKQKQIPKVNKKLIPIIDVFTIKFRNNYVIVLYLFYCVCSVVLVSVCMYQYVICSCDCFVSVSNM